ncbi:uncharacterized protein LOC143039450 [Oratosquilla oratoria]|uniref:uncharacterized protein LOC143039450 n=1 Tax=Oratosquilla oratoria TaxID=337810 RepID=UPI003F774EBC
MASKVPAYSSYFPVEEKNVFKLFGAIRKTGPVARALGSIVGLLNKCESVPVKQYCEETLKYNSKTYKSVFNEDDRNLLENDVPWEEMDITLLYKLFQQICGLAPKGNVKWTSGTDDQDCLEYSLTKLKNIRNHVVHSLVSLTDAKLKSFFTDIIEFLENVFVKVGEKLGKDMSFESGAATKEIWSSFRSPLPLSSIQEYQLSLEETQKDLIKVILSEGQKDLYELYEGAWFISPFPWSNESIFKEIEISKVYTSLQLETSNTVDIEKLLVLQHNDGSMPRIICINGVTGAGKTSLCSYLLYSWCQDPMAIEGMKDVDFLYLIQCRYSRDTSLINYIRNEFMPDACSKLEYNDISPVLKKCRNLFIFDGFDEADPKMQQLFQEALNWPLQTRVIVTSRPEFMKDAMELIEINTRCSTPLTISIYGFEEAKKKEYILKLFSNLVIDVSERTSKMNAFLTYLDNIGEAIRSILYLPLTLSLIVFIWLEDESRAHGIHTTTSLYVELVRLKLCRLAKRLQHGCSKHFDEILNDCYNKFLSELSREAYIQLRKFQFWIDEKGIERIQKVCSPDIDTTQALSSLLDYKRPVSQTARKRIWDFPHKSLQEVLAAYFVHECYKRNMVPPGFETLNNRPFGSTLIHAIGLMHLQKPEPDYVNMEKVAHLLNIIYDDRNDTVNSFFMSGLILRETECSLIGRKIAKKLISNHNIPKRIYLDHVSLEQLHIVLQNIDVSVPSEISLEYSGSGVRSYTEIIPALKKHNVILNLRCFFTGEDFDPKVFKELMGCNTIDIHQLNNTDIARQIGEIWASQIGNKSEASIAISINFLVDINMKVNEEKQVPQITFFFLRNIFLNFLSGIQKAGISLQKGSLALDGCFPMLNNNNIQIVSNVISQFPLSLPEIISLDSAYIDDGFLTFAQKVKERHSSLRIKKVYISECDYIFRMQTLFDVIDCDISMHVNQGVEIPVHCLAHKWAKRFINQSDNRNTVYNIRINQIYFTLDISVIVSNLKEYRIMSLTTDFHHEGNIEILDKCASDVVSAVEKVGLRRGGQIDCNLMFPYNFHYNTELMNMIEKWSPTNGKDILEGRVSLMASAYFNVGIVSLVEYLNTRDFKMNKLPGISICNSEHLQVITENLGIVMRLYKECGITLKFSDHFHVSTFVIQQFCHRWVSTIGTIHKVRLHISCTGFDSIQLNIDVQTWDSFHFLILQQIHFGKNLVLVITALLEEFRKASVPVHKGQMTFGVLAVNYNQIEVIADLLSVLSFSVEEPVIFRGPVDTDAFKRMCTYITENGSSVYLESISIFKLQDLNNQLVNMEWIRKMHLIPKLKLELFYSGSQTNFLSFVCDWTERLPHVNRCALKLVCECSTEVRSIIFSVQLEERVETLELFSVGNVYSRLFLFEKCSDFLKVFQEAGGNLELSQIEIINSDLMLFDTREFRRFLYIVPLKLCRVTEFTRALMDSSLIYLMKQVKDKDSEIKITDYLVLNSKSLPLICKYISSVKNMFVKDDMVFELQRNEMPEILDLELFGSKWLESGDIPASVNLSVTCSINDIQIVCSMKEAPLVPKITWRQKLSKDWKNDSHKDWTTILEILIPFLKGIQAAGVKMEDCHLVFEEIALLEFSHSFKEKLESIPVTFEKVIPIHDVVGDAEFILLVDFLASQGTQVQITGTLILVTEDALLLFVKDYEKLQRMFPDHMLKLCVTGIKHIQDETFDLLVHMWLSPLVSLGGSENLDVKLTCRDQELSLECSIRNGGKVPTILWLADTESCNVIVWAKILASFIDHVRLAGIAVDNLDFGNIDIVALTPMLLNKVIGILSLENKLAMNLGRVKISREVIDLIKSVSVKVDCFVVDNDVEFVVLTRDFEEICKTVVESKLILYLNMEEFLRKLPVCIFGEKWASKSEVLTDAKVIIELTCRDEEISVNCSFGNGLTPDIQWKTNLENIEIIGEVVRLFLDGTKGSGVKNVVLSLCHIDYMDFAHEFVNNLLRKIKADFIREFEIMSFEINEDSKSLWKYIGYKNCTLRIIGNYEISRVCHITPFIDDFDKWLKFTGGSRISVLVTFDFLDDVEPLMKLGHTWVKDLIFPSTNKLKVHFSYEEEMISMALDIHGSESEDIPTFVWKTYQGNEKVLAQVVTHFLGGVNKLGVPTQEGEISNSRDVIVNLPQELRNLIRTLKLHIGT